MSLGHKLVLSLGALALVYVGVLVAVHERLIVRSFEELERAAAEDDLARVRAALDGELAALGVLVRDWAVWDDAFQFVADGSPEFIASNLTAESLANADLAGVVVLDADGAVVHASVGAAGGPPLGVESLEPIARRLHTRVQADAGAALGGLATTSFVAAEGELWLIGGMPVRDSAGTAAPNGTLVMCRPLTAERLAHLRDRTRVDLALAPAPAALVPGDSVTWTETADTLTSHVALLDDAGHGVAQLTVRVPREISLRGHGAADLAHWTSAGGLGILLGALFLLLRRDVVRPLEQLAASAVRIGSNDEAAVIAPTDREDEIGALARELAAMTERLTTSRRDLVHASRTAGRAEVSASILHNVGNGLNVVHVAAGIIRERIRDSESRAQMAELVALVEAQGAQFPAWLADDPRGPQFGPVLADVARTLLGDFEEVAAESQRLSQGVEHVRHVLERQRQSVGARSTYESFTLTELLGEAAQLARVKRDGEAGIIRRAIIGEIEGAPRLLGAKHRILEVLVNLVNNAADALREACTPNPVIALRAERLPNGRVRFEVEDNGPGVPAALRSSLFRFGFTTKAEGSGIGLHTSAQIATELGGQLELAEPSPAGGACFRFSLPLESLSAGGDRRAAA